ncbi:DedA family protein [Naumannella cuiyingiana]|uniref:Membrane protein DedA with SNARE-associated domain n=1 Tax=Naumannella cuiyingiana TaxID=1347891 RepID=A0A7Z0D629_9ACTN|nr:VTT domain-containing protein [Naumannella cuiyingiana]NYI69580.1 membrane protein DedA with SNARE-associated domain [Naumannella cuiyingiana]
MDLLAVLSHLTETITALASTPWVYPVVLALTTIDGFFPPVPSESVVVSLAALSVSDGNPSLPLLFLAAALGAVAGDNVAYQIGRVLHPGGERGPRFLRGERMARAFAWARRALEHRAAVMILVARHIPVGRVAVNMMAGATGYPRRRFVPLTILAGTLWAAYGIGIGTVAGSWVKDQPLLAAALAVALALVLGFALDRVLEWFNRRRGVGTPGGPDAPAPDPASSSSPR